VRSGFPPATRSISKESITFMILDFQSKIIVIWGYLAPLKRTSRMPFQGMVAMVRTGPFGSLVALESR